MGGDAVAAGLVAGEVGPVQQRHPQRGSTRSAPMAAVTPVGLAPTTARSQALRWQPR